MTWDTIEALFKSDGVDTLNTLKDWQNPTLPRSYRQTVLLEFFHRCYQHDTGEDLFTAAGVEEELLEENASLKEEIAPLEQRLADE